MNISIKIDEAFWQSLGETVSRFFFALVYAITGTFAAISLIDQTGDEGINTIKLLMSCGLGLSWFIAIRIFAERRGLSRTQQLGIEFVAFALLVAYFFSLPNEIGLVTVLRYLLWGVSVHLLVAVAPYWLSQEENGFWQYNQTIFLRIVLSALYSATLYFGLSIAILSIDQLFDVNINSKVYARLWFFIVGIFNTMFFLVGFPKNLAALDADKTYPKGLKIFTQFVLLPLITVYLGILYVYAVKILLQWNLPKGWVSYLVLIFSTTGVFALLLIYPIRDLEGNKWIKIYTKWFYVALFPLILLLFIAIFRRVRDYGLTENRYFVIALACWLAAMAAYFLLSRQKNIQIIPNSLLIVALLSSFGPWSAFQVAENSQMARLKGILTKHKILVNQKINPVSDGRKIPEKDAAEIKGIIDFLSDRNGLAALKPYFKDNLDTLFAQAGKKKYYVKDKLYALILPNQFDGNTGVSKTKNFYTPNFEQVVVVKGYDYYFNLSLDLSAYHDSGNSATPIQFSNEDERFVIINKLNENRLVLMNDTTKLLSFDLQDFAKNMQRKYGDTQRSEVPSSAMILVEENKAYKAQLNLTNIVLADDGKKLTVQNLRGVLLLKKKN